MSRLLRSKAWRWSLLVGLGACLLSSLVRAETLFEQAVQENLAEAYATTVLLTDGESIQLGLLNFNPNDYAELDDPDLGTADSVSGRETLSIFSLPLEYQVPVSLTRHVVHAGLRMSMLRRIENSRLVNTTTGPEDRVETRVYAVEGGVDWRYHWTDTWKLDLGQAFSLLRYENRTDFRNPDSRFLQPLLDGVVTNVSSESWLSHTTTGVAWLAPLEQATTEWFSSFTYLAGDSIQPSANAQDAETEAWYWRNGIRSKIPVFIHSDVSRHVILKLSRVNVGGHLREPMGSSVFYEAGVGFIVNTYGRIPWTHNLGLFLNLNYGSDLRGGTIGILYNVD